MPSSVPVSMLIDCPACAGEGYTLYLEPAGSYLEDAATFVPQENLGRCAQCGGEGQLEVCAVCLTPFDIKAGREVCACTALELHLPQAA